MEDIVAVEVRLDNGRKRHFLTWGRIQNPVDPAPLEALVLRHCTRFSLGGTPVSARLCDTLQEASAGRYFYECFFLMCQERIPFGPQYGKWAARAAAAMEKGKELYFLGAPESERTSGSGTIAYGRDNFPL